MAIFLKDLLLKFFNDNGTIYGYLIQNVFSDIICEILDK